MKPMTFLRTRFTRPSYATQRVRQTCLAHPSLSVSLRRLSAVALLTLASVSLTLDATAPAAAQQTQSYIQFNAPIAPQSTEQIEVLDFFSYGCSHCAVMVPRMTQWEQRLPENVVIRRVPVAFNASMEPMQRFYFAIEALERLDLHAKLFDAIHRQRQRLFTQDALIKWAVEQGVSEDAMRNAWQSFGVGVKVKRANELVQAYRIDGTPAIGIHGSYLTSPALAGGYDESIIQAQALLERVLNDSPRP